MARRYGRRLLERFFAAVDGEGVELYQWLFYLIIAFDGAQNLFIAHAQPLTLRGSMGIVPFQWWCALEMAAPLLCLVGRVLQDTKWWQSANRLQITGDLTLAGSELSYVVATFQIEPVGRGGHGGYLGLAFTLSAGLLAVRDYRRLRERK